MTRNLVLLATTMVFVIASATFAAPVTLVKDGKAQCCVVVGPEKDFTEPKAFNWEPNQTLLQWAAEDVATYLGKMSGATVPVATSRSKGCFRFTWDVRRKP